MPPPSEDSTAPCEVCGKRFNIRGISNHRAACKSKAENAQSDRKFAANLKAQKQKAAYAHMMKSKAPKESALTRSLVSSSRPLDPQVQLEEDFPELPPSPDFSSSHSPTSEHSDEEPHLPPRGSVEIKHEIKRVFHPHTRRSPIFQSFSDYVTSNVSEHTVPMDQAPWKPFRTRLDFEVAEFCELAMLNKEMTETLINLIQRCGNNMKDFTLLDHSELNRMWELASHKCTEFVEDTITIPYKTENHQFKTYTHPLWDWVLSLVQDPNLASCFVWDAEKVYKYNGDTYVRFYHEPWTADAFWSGQSAIPDHPAAKPLGLILYADKSKLSTFGTEKGYPVIARIANIRVHIRNSTQFGGGQVVGHQPVVKDNAKENHKPAFSNFKNVVWHAAFWKLIESLVHHSKVGSWTECGDKVLPHRCVMTLIRGLQALYPCPICFVPWNEQSDLSTEHPRRTAEDSKQKLQEARACQTLAQREEILKENSLQDVENVFWGISNSDPHNAISFDRLHAYGGLWTDHIFAQMKLRITEKGRAASVKIDAQMSAMPRWRGLNHFDAIMNITFNDGKKNEDMAKMMLFAAHNVLVDKPGILLLRILRSFLELNMYVSLEVHTSETIVAGRDELLIFDAVVQEYIEACYGTDYAEKSWNFPKMHSHRHVFDDIEKKGASRNFGTKMNESMHGPIRQMYHRLTNFKNVTPQLVKHDHRRAVALFIREQVDILDAPEDASQELDDEVLSNISIGSKLGAITFAAIEDTMSADTAFQRFRIRFGEFLSEFLPVYGHQLPNGKRVRFDPSDKITPFQFVKVHYEHLGNWTSTADYLRCNPNFHGQKRYDGALVKTADGHIFVQLIYMFSWTAEKKSHPFALVLPLATHATVSRKDRALRLHRLHTQPRRNSEFISAHSIVRGVALAPDFDNAGEFFIVDIVDTDISLRLKEMYPSRYL
ncbi:hypothetical protein B0H11DRAFT_2168801 [Mycena galericulata]|nr:hypothetical protein B0H11DRAFT_2168801 [Mycena galericulata]